MYGQLYWPVFVYLLWKGLSVVSLSLLTAIQYIFLCGRLHAENVIVILTFLWNQLASCMPLIYGLAQSGDVSGLCSWMYYVDETLGFCTKWVAVLCSARGCGLRLRISDGRENGALCVEAGGRKQNNYSSNFMYFCFVFPILDCGPQCKCRRAAFCSSLV